MTSSFHHSLDSTQISNITQSPRSSSINYKQFHKPKPHPSIYNPTTRCPIYTLVPTPPPPPAPSTSFPLAASAPEPCPPPAQACSPSTRTINTPHNFTP